MLEPTKKNVNRLFNSIKILEKNNPIEIKIITFLFLAEMPLRLDDIAIGLSVEKMLNHINNLHKEGLIFRYGRGTKYILSPRGNALVEEWALRMDD